MTTCQTINFKKGAYHLLYRLTSRFTPLIARRSVHVRQYTIFHTYNRFETVSEGRSCVVYSRTLFVCDMVFTTAPT